MDWLCLGLHMQISCQRRGPELAGQIFCPGRSNASQHLLRLGLCEAQF